MYSSAYALLSVHVAHLCDACQLSAELAESGVLLGLDVLVEL